VDSQRGEAATRSGAAADFQNPEYHIRPLSGDEFPLDYSRHHEDFPRKTNHQSIDLIVAKLGVSPEELFDDFDLMICKAKFNGFTFSFVNPIWHSLVARQLSLSERHERHFSDDFQCPPISF
jgi:hypothetical protein